jgi:U3 small nucleolar RNA-associated protein 14
VITFNGVNVSTLVRRNGNTEGATSAFALDDITDLNKIAFKYKENDFALWVNGVEVGTDNSGLTFPINTLTKANLSDGGSGSDFYGKTSQIQVFNTALTDQELTELTYPITYDSFNEMANALNLTII